MRRHYERGQVLPLWTGAIITTLMFAFLAMNYGNTVRWQIRAQNAADSVAQGLMAIQAERFNKLEVALYATGVEEYRLRHLLNGILLAANDSGGCEDSYNTATWYANLNHWYGPFSEGTCAQVYHDLTVEYGYSLNRYTVDAKLVNDYSNYATWSNWTSDSISTLEHLYSAKQCNSASPLAVNPAGTDCQFFYNITGQSMRTGLLAVQQDAQDILVPGLGHDSSLANDTENAQLFDPGEVEVTACVKVPPIIPNFGPMNLGTQYAFGRAAATAVQFEQDWFEPGYLVDPTRPAGTVFQPEEEFSIFQPGTDSSETYDWYGVNFGGNAAVAYVNYGDFHQDNYTDEYSVRMGWWNSIAIKPFATTAPTIAADCSSSET